MQTCINFSKNFCSPKFYILKSTKNDDDQDMKKMKGVSSRLNNRIYLESYVSFLLKSAVLVIRIYCGFMIVESDPLTHTRQMVKYVQRKKAINGSALDKIIVLEIYVCAPLFPNITKDDYYIRINIYILLQIFFFNFFNFFLYFFTTNNKNFLVLYFSF
jgi:hypothetical protein